jgi:hypothetical protein
VKPSILFAAVMGGLTGIAYCQPSTRPTTRPVDVGALVAQLSAPEFRTREAAGAELRKLGPAALPALREAERSDDPEVQTRAGALVKEIEQAAKKKLRPRPEGLGKRGTSRSTSTMTMTVNGRTTTRKTETVVMDGRKEVTVTEDARTVQIVEDEEGIQMVVTEKAGREEETKAYEAKSAEELKEKEPGAFAIYREYTQDEADPRLLRGRRPVPPPRIRVRPVPPPELPE